MPEADLPDTVVELVDAEPVTVVPGRDVACPATQVRACSRLVPVRGQRAVLHGPQMPQRASSNDGLGRAHDAAGVNAEMLVQIGDRARLAEMLDA